MLSLFIGKHSEPRGYPRHQPELDPAEVKCHNNKFETTSMAAYKDFTKETNFYTK